MSPKSSDELELGVVIRAQGLHGAVGVKLFHPESHSVEDAPLDALVLDGGGRRLAVSKVISRQKERVVLAVEGIADRDAAEALRGAKLFVARDAVALGPEEFLYADLLGCVAVEGERELGEVVEVFSAGASDVLVVRDDQQEWLIPLVDPWVGEVDIEGRRIALQGADQWEGQPHSAPNKGRAKGRDGGREGR